MLLAGYAPAAASRADREGLARGDVDLHGRLVAEAERVDRQVIGDRDVGSRGVDVDVRRGRGGDERRRVGCGVSVGRETGGAEGADAGGEGSTDHGELWFFLRLADFPVWYLRIPTVGLVGV